MVLPVGGEDGVAEARVPPQLPLAMAAGAMPSWQRNQRPSLVMPTGNGFHCCRSMFSSTDAAVSRDTSCSLETPPKSTATVFCSIPSAPVFL